MEDDKRVMELDRATYAVILNSLIDLVSKPKSLLITTTFSLGLCAFRSVIGVCSILVMISIPRSLANA